ncbi:hypothetical protein [Undibacterium aquatile]|uniref:Uncharacterized protein n=1 Tax=Undibacterium aquatile TaxID=1537398 RepID=A0ABR6XIK5_9BURK|nr:hypothetical protein [Undibacterium aquatile]MBC3812735.1 hypothetical protein [Undibacterium aquatile]
MQIIRITLLLLTIAFSLGSHGVAESHTDSKQSAEFQREVDYLKRDLKRTDDDIAILHRDQINYQLEKDLLKETYSTNYQTTALTISLVSTSVGIIFAIIGYLSFKSVGKLKDEFSNELQNARMLKSGLEIEIEELRKKQKHADEEISKLNQKQATTIQVLEIVEKASALINSGSYVWAIENIEAGLAINPTYPPLIKGVWYVSNETG